MDEDKEQWMKRRVEAAGLLVKASVEVIGYEEAYDVAVDLGFQAGYLDSEDSSRGVDWNDGKMRIHLTDLQLVAYAAALHTQRLGMPRK